MKGVESGFTRSCTDRALTSEYCGAALLLPVSLWASEHFNASNGCGGALWCPLVAPFRGHFLWRPPSNCTKRPQHALVTLTSDTSEVASQFRRTHHQAARGGVSAPHAQLICRVRQCRRLGACLRSKGHRVCDCAVTLQSTFRIWCAPSQRPQVTSSGPRASFLSWRALPSLTSSYDMVVRFGSSCCSRLADRPAECWRLVPHTGRLRVGLCRCAHCC